MRSVGGEDRRDEGGGAERGGDSVNHETLLGTLS